MGQDTKNANYKISFDKNKDVSHFIKKKCFNCLKHKINQ